MRKPNIEVTFFDILFARMYIIIGIFGILRVKIYFSMIFSKKTLHYPLPIREKALPLHSQTRKEVLFRNDLNTFCAKIVL